MPVGPQIVILTHALQGLGGHAMLERLWREHWQPAGLSVQVQQGLAKPPPADLALLHVDLTVTPPEYLALADRYPRCLNRAVTDISKRRISQRRVLPDDDYRGPVIVKTGRNFAGRPERALALAAGGLTRLRELLARRLPPAWSGRLRDDRYLLLPDRRAVPDWVWRRPELLVERLAVERQGETFLLHQWYFLGRCDCIATLVGAEPLVTYEKRIALLPPHFDVPPALRRRRAELGFDFGKFDYVIEQGEPVLLDANRTPAIDEIGGERARLLAPGIHDFLPGRV